VDSEDSKVWSRSWFDYWAGRLTDAYWGRVLLLTVAVGVVLVGFSALDPVYAELRYHFLMMAVIFPSAARSARQMSLATVPMCVYTGSRVRWALEEPSFENWTLLLFPLLLVALLVWLSFNYNNLGTTPLLGWIGLPDGRQLPVVFAPCGCRAARVHFKVMALGGDIEFDFGDDYTFNVPKGPRVLRYNLIMREVDGRRFLRSLDTRC
jgi:hypothetical protein